jgi:hypothetical protein
MDTKEYIVYVYDAKTKYRVNKEEDVEKHQEELDKIYTWQRCNNMNFNTSMFQVFKIWKKCRTKRKYNVLHL